MKKKIIVFGCQKITIDLIGYLSKRKDIELSLVVTYEIFSDISRGQKSVIDFAKKLKVKVINPNSVNEELIKKIRKLNPDLIISCYYRRIFPKSLINIPKQGIINIHPSLLPEFRGPVPTAWAIYNDKDETGITIHAVDSGVDTGKIYVQSKFKIKPDETGYELYVKAMKEGFNLFKKNFDKIINSEILPYKQPKGGSYYGKLNLNTRIDWKLKANTIKNIVRIFSLPYSPAQTRLENKYFFINKCSIYRKKEVVVQIPGKILKVLKNKNIVVSCSDGAVILEDYYIFPPMNKIEEKILIKNGGKFSYD